MYKFILTSKKYGDKTVSIDDADKKLLFKQDENGQDVHLYKWYIGYKNNTKKFYVFRYIENPYRIVSQTLSNFLTNDKRTFFVDNNCLNCCRSNFNTRKEIYGSKNDPLFSVSDAVKRSNGWDINPFGHEHKKAKHDPLFDMPDHFKPGNDEAYLNACGKNKTYEEQKEKDKRDIDAAWDFVQEKYSKKRKEK